MANTLIFPDGVRLFQQSEVPGPESRLLEEWKRVQVANIAPGFVIRRSGETKFAAYAEINVDAPEVWAVFRELSRSLLSQTATFVIGEVDEEPISVGTGKTPLLLDLLQRHKYQLAHDGMIHFGLVSEHTGKVAEIWVAPTKHFCVWLDDEKLFLSIMKRYGLRESEHLEFLDQYPRITRRLPSDKLVFANYQELINHLAMQIGKLPP